MTEEVLKDGICEYVHNIHKTEPFNGFSYRDLRDVAEHFALPREKRIEELENKVPDMEIGVNIFNSQERKIAELEAQIEKMKSDSRTAYIKGIRTMANALKKCDRTYGAWTDYFEHTVDKVLKELLKGLGE